MIQTIVREGLAGPLRGLLGTLAPPQSFSHDEHKTRKLELQTEALAFADKVAYAPDINQRCAPEIGQPVRIH